MVAVVSGDFSVYKAELSDRVASSILIDSTQHRTQATANINTNLSIPPSGHFGTNISITCLQNHFVINKTSLFNIT